MDPVTPVFEAAQCRKKAASEPIQRGRWKGSLPFVDLKDQRANTSMRENWVGWVISPKQVAEQIAKTNTGFLRI